MKKLTSMAIIFALTICLVGCAASEETQAKNIEYDNIICENVEDVARYCILYRPFTIVSDTIKVTFDNNSITIDGVKSNEESGMMIEMLDYLSVSTEEEACDKTINKFKSDNAKGKGVCVEMMIGVNGSVSIKSYSIGDPANIHHETQDTITIEK